MNHSIIIGVDHGNKQIKTSNRVFPSGLVERERAMTIGSQDTIRYNGKYYALSENRLHYMPDKTVDQHFLVLTLFAIAYEIEYRQAYQQDDYLSVDLLTGLPPAHLALQKDTFAAYFMAGDGIDFEMNGKPYHVIIDSVQVYPQGFAAVLPCFKEIKQTPYTFIVDIGGMTVDYLQLANGKPNLEVCSNLEKGIIKLYSDINRRLITDAGEELTERQIDAVIKGKYNIERKDLIDKMCQNYVRDLLNQLREEAGNFKSAQLYFVGGGSSTLKSYIENCKDLVRSPIFISDVHTNAKGYQILFQSRKA